jgi:hypothetical protein
MRLVNSTISVISSIGKNLMGSTITSNIFSFGRIVKVAKTVVNITISTIIQ